MGILHKQAGLCGGRVANYTGVEWLKPIFYTFPTFRLARSGNGKGLV